MRGTVDLVRRWAGESADCRNTYADIDLVLLVWIQHCGDLLS